MCGNILKQELHNGFITGLNVNPCYDYQIAAPYRGIYGAPNFFDCGCSASLTAPAVQESPDSAIRVLPNREFRIYKECAGITLINDKLLTIK